MFSQRSIRSIYRGMGPDLDTLALCRIRNRRLLVAEDDRELWPIIQRIGLLVDPDLAIDFASTPQETIEYMSDPVRYDAVLLDYCLPSPGDGTRLMSPADVMQPWARVALMSGRPEIASSVRAFLPKPFSPAHGADFLKDLLF